MANGSMSSNQSGEGEIRKNLIEADFVDGMIALPGQLLYLRCLWSSYYPSNLTTLIRFNFALRPLFIRSVIVPSRGNIERPLITSCSSNGSTNTDAKLL